MTWISLIGLGIKVRNLLLILFTILLITNTIFNFIWKANAPPKAKVHMWLIGHKKLNTIELLKKKNVYYDTKCLFCNLHLESISHLYFGCNNTEFILMRTLDLFDFKFNNKVLDCDFYWNNLRFTYRND